LLLAASSIPPLWKRNMRWISTVQNNDFADSHATIYSILWFIWQVHHSNSVAMNCWCRHFSTIQESRLITGGWCTCLGGIPEEWPVVT
jgi:hypothetical protein